MGLEFSFDSVSFLVFIDFSRVRVWAAQTWRAARIGDDNGRDHVKHLNRS